MSLRIVVLVAPGRHPVSGRPRRAPLDARAVEMALSIANASVSLVHAGDPEDPALREYLGMGLDTMTVVDLPPTADRLPALVDHLVEAPPDVTLCGQRAEGGEGSGLLPYMLGEALGMTVVPNVVSLERDGPAARLLQALPRGQRRAVRASFPLVAAVDAAAPAPCQNAVGPAMRAGIVRVPARRVVEDAEAAAWTTEAARPRPKRLKTAKGSSAERFMAAVSMQGGGGQVVRDVTPEEAAQRILAVLRDQKVIGRRNAP